MSSTSPLRSLCLFASMAAAALALTTAITPLAAQTWTPVGPSPTVSPEALTNVIGIGENPASGAMRMVLPSPTNADVLYAGAVNGGVWQTLNGGVNWKPIGDDLASLSIGAMAFDQNDPTRLWVGFGKQSSFSSLGGAQTGVVLFDTRTGLWESVTSDLLGKDISQIIANGDNVIVSVKTSHDAPGVWRSSDGGKTFTNQTTGTALPNGNITSLVGDPSTPGRYYAAVITEGAPDGVKGVYRTDDGGVNWTHLSSLPLSQPGAPGTRVTYDVMLSIANDGTLIASVIDPIKTDGKPIRENPQVIVYRTSDQGQSWVSMGSASSTEKLPDGTTVQWGIYTGGQFNMHGALLVDPNDSTVVYISGDAQGPSEIISGGGRTSLGATVYSGRLFRGKFDERTGETIWEAITDDFTSTGSGPHADSRFMMIDSNGNLLQTDDGGVYLRTDPKSRSGVWQSLNGNLQTGEIHAARWNPLSHTVATAMQDNGATVQLKAGDPTHVAASGGDGGIAAVNADWNLNGQRYAAVYTSSQFLSGVARSRIDSQNNGIERTYLDIGIEKDGQFVPFGDSSGAIKPPRPKKPVTKAEALAAQTLAGVEAVPFYPAFALNSVDPTRLALGGFDLYVGQDSMEESDSLKVPIVMQKLPLVGLRVNEPSFISVAYGATNNDRALLGGTGHQSTIDATGSLYYTPDVNSATAPVRVYEGTGVQAALFDRGLGTERIYFTDGLNIHRGAENAPRDANPYQISDITGNLPESFNERRGLDHIFNNGVSALVAAGTHNVSGGNWLYTLRGPASSSSFNWDTRLGRIPNSQVFGLDYSSRDDVLLAYTMGRGAFALTDVTTHFPEATRLVFGQADNTSQPVNAQLTDGRRLDDNTPFSRPLIKVGSGTLDLSGTTAGYSGGTQLNGGLTIADADANLGAAHTGISFDGGRLNLLDGFVLDDSNTFTRSLTVNLGGGTLDTANNTIPFAGSIDGGGMLNFLGRPLKMAGDVRMNATWNGPLEVTSGNTLRGVGYVNGPLTVHGALYPGNSPGTMTVSGPVTQMPGSTFALDIDGSGTGNGAGNYSRLLGIGVNSAYTAGGKITPILRGITGSANNDYTPTLGQGFTVVQVDGPVSGSYDALIQPPSGLLTGSRFDAVYRNQAIELYVTPAHYADLQPLGIDANSNQFHIGMALDRVRPAAGPRASPDRKIIFDALAPVAANHMKSALDQIGGVGYAPLLSADLNNSKFLTTQLMNIIGDGRSSGHGVQTRASRPDGNNVTWAYAFHRDSRLDSDDNGQGYADTSNSMLVGLERRLQPGSRAGIGFGYTDSKTNLTERLGSGRLQSWQLMIYGSQEHNGWFVDGAVGLGMGQIAARRNLTLTGLNDTYRADLRSRNLAASGRTGWGLGGTDNARFETWLGLHYLAGRHLSASERGADVAAALSLSPGTLQSLSPSIGLKAHLSFRKAGIDWRASATGGLSHELLDRQATATVAMLGSSMDLKGAAARRTTVNAGLGLNGQIDKNLSVRTDVFGELGGHWRAASAGLSLRVQW